MEFDFDAWAELARDDPSDFERRREAALRAVIEAAPARHRRRLEGLQFRVDMERRRAGSPMAACVKLNAMMWASFVRLKQELDGLVYGTPHEAPVKTHADVIPMRRFVRSRGATPGGEN